MSIINYNEDINPFFPFLCIHPELLNGELETYLQSETEKVLLTAHIDIGNHEGMLVLSNQRLLIYKTKSKTGFFGNMLKSGLGDIIVGVVPGLGEIMDAKDSLIDGRDNFNMLFNRKAKKRKEAKAEQDQLDKLAVSLTLPETELLDSKDFTTLVNNSWSLLNTFGTQIRISKKRLKFERQPDIKIDDDWEYYSKLKRTYNFLIEDTDVVIASLILPNREIFQKLGWDLFYEGKDLIIANANHKKQDEASEDIFNNIINHDLFGLSDEESVFVQLSPEELPNIEPQEFREAIEDGIDFLNQTDLAKEIQDIYLDKRSNEDLLMMVFEIEPKGKDIDDMLWVIGGAFPLTTFAGSEMPSTTEALAFYAQEAKQWIAYVRGETDQESAIFFDAEESEETANAFEELINILVNDILPTL